MLLYGVVTYSTPSIISGVLSKNPGIVSYSSSGVSQCFHCQATCSRWTFVALMSVSGEYFVPARIAAVVRPLDLLRGGLLGGDECAGGKDHDNHDPAEARTPDLRSG